MAPQRRRHKGGVRVAHCLLLRFPNRQPNTDTQEPMRGGVFFFLLGLAHAQITGVIQTCSG